MRSDKKKKRKAMSGWTVSNVVERDEEGNVVRENKEKEKKVVAVQTPVLTSISFELLGPAEIRKQSFVEVTRASNYAGKVPCENGLFDLRMGTMSKHLSCQTCGNGIEQCSGHFGHIELAAAVYHPGVLSVVLKILQAVCFSCGRLSVQASDIKVQHLMATTRRITRLNEITKLAKSKPKCWACDRRKPSFKKLKGELVLQLYWKTASSSSSSSTKEDEDEEEDEKKEEEKEERKSRTLSAEEARRVLERVTAEDLEILDCKTRPEFMILTTLLVPPPCVRPPIQVSGGSNAIKGHDDLTRKLTKILNANIILRRKLVGATKKKARKDEEEEEEQEAEEEEEEEEEQEAAGDKRKCVQITAEKAQSNLQYHVATYFDNNISGQKHDTHHSGVQIKGIRQRLAGKSGRIRNNCNGKRVDFSSRANAGPDPNCDVDEIVVPERVARILTYPVRVVAFNLEFCKRLLKEDRVGKVELVHPLSSPFSFSSSSAPPPIYKTVLLETCDSAERQALIAQLCVGCVVHRHMMTGDCVLMNRQPSLHMKSIMAHRVRVLPWNTFRLNLFTTTPYNADFDGDEINLHLPQDDRSQAEMREMMLVSKQLLHAQNNKPCFGMKLDALTAVKFFTSRHTFLTRAQSFQALVWLSCSSSSSSPSSSFLEVPVPAILRPVELWTGKQLLSCIFPPQLHLTKRVRDLIEDDVWDERERCVVIQGGELLCGSLCKETLGTSSGSITHYVALDYDQPTACRMLNSLSFFLNYWFTDVGFSVGLDDCEVRPATHDSILHQLQDTFETIDTLVARVETHESSPAAALDMLTALEPQLYAYLNGIMIRVGQTASKTLSEQKNSLQAMISAGAKGNILNVAQITACVGQQCVNGQRIRQRLPCFSETDFNKQCPEARGFVQNSYVQGLTPVEFFFHTMGGREGLVDTAVKTSETGYTERRLMAALSSLHTAFDGSVRTAAGVITQFAYGGDGMDAALLEKVSLRFLEMDDAALHDECCEVEVQLNVAASGEVQLNVAASGQSAWRELRRLRDQLRHSKVTLCAPLLITTVLSPVNVERLFLRLFSSLVDTPITPAREMSRSSSSSSSCFSRKPKVLCDRIARRYGELATLGFRAHVLWECRPKKLKGLTEAQVDVLLSKVEETYERARVAPGEMVGALATQSNSEPGMQMTFNTFHYAGVSSKNVTLGIPRLKEILNLLKVIQKPVTTLYLKRKGDNPINPTNPSIDVSIIARQLRQTLLKDVIASSSVRLDPHAPPTTAISADRDLVRNFACFWDPATVTFQPYVIRFVLDSNKLTARGLTCASIGLFLQRLLGPRVFVEYASAWRPTKVIRVRLLFTEESEVDVIAAMKKVRRTRKMYRNKALGRSPDEDDPDDSDLSEDDAEEEDEEEENEEDDEKQDANEEEEEEDTKTLRQYEMTSFVHTFLLDGVTLSGIPNILNTTEREITTTVFHDTKSETRKLVVIDTAGTNLRAIWALDEVNWTHTLSNDIYEVNALLGIESAAYLLFHEIRTVLSFDGTYIDPRHIVLVINTMTQSGQFSPITRHGLKRSGNGVLACAGFEESMEILYNAATFHESDKLQGIAENVMTGQMARGMGTNSAEMLFKCVDDNLASPHDTLFRFSSSSSSSSPHEVAVVFYRVADCTLVDDRASDEYFDPTLLDADVQAQLVWLTKPPPPPPPPPPAPATQDTHTLNSISWEHAIIRLKEADPVVVEADVGAVIRSNPGLYIDAHLAAAPAYEPPTPPLPSSSLSSRSPFASLFPASSSSSSFFSFTHQASATSTDLSLTHQASAAPPTDVGQLSSFLTSIAEFLPTTRTTTPVSMLAPDGSVDLQRADLFLSAFVESKRATLK